MNDTVYSIVTDQIIRKLKEGTVPWKQPWQGLSPQSWKSKRPYHGINLFLVPPGEYATFKQINEAGGRIIKGQQGWIVVFWKITEFDDEEREGRKKKIPLLRYYKVWEISTQCEGLESKLVTVKHDPLPEAEAIIAGYKTCPEITGSRTAWYKPSKDIIGMPHKQFFPKVEDYYGTLFHEMTHSTGHDSRLHRFDSAGFSGFLDNTTYSKEELIAEMGSAMLCYQCGLSPATIQNSANYIGCWLKTLKDDPKMVVSAAGKANAAFRYILGEEEKENEVSS